MLYIIVDIGCLECGYSSKLIGVTKTEEAARKLIKEKSEYEDCIIDVVEPGENTGTTHGDAIYAIFKIKETDVIK